MAKAYFLQDDNGNKIYPYSHADATFTSDGEKVGAVLDEIGIELKTKVPQTRKINGKALSADITLSASDIGADINGSANQALTDAKSYTDTKIDAIVGEGASTTLDTIGEISKAIEEHQDVTDALNSAIGNKVDKLSGKGLSTNDYTTDDKTKLDITNIAYGTCSTDAATAAKVVTISGNTNWKLAVGSIIVVKFTNTSTATNVTLNVNNTGAKSIWYNTGVFASNSSIVNGAAGRFTAYMYDGTYWVWLTNGADANTTYTNAALGQGYGTCATAEATTAKVVTLASYALTVGGIVAVKFTYNVPASSTLNVNSKGTKAIFYRGAAITANVIKAGDIATFIYDGTQYHLLTVDRDVDTNTDTKATQTNTTTNADYRVVLSTNANDTTETNTLRKSGNFTANPSTGAFFAKGYDRIDITGQTLDINTLNLSAGSPEIMRYIEKTSGGANNITNIPITGQPFTLDVELVRWASATDYVSRQIFNSVGAKNNEYVRWCTNGTWTSWTQRIFTDNNTDTKVTQTVKSDNANYPLLLAPSGQTATTTTTACFDSGVTLNPSTNTIVANVSGNAGTATKLANPHTIDGVSFDGTAGITHYGTCSTAAATVAKVVACTGFVLGVGATIKVRFTVTNTAANPTLNVNNTGAKAIYYRNAAISAGYLAVNRTYEFVYDGTYYQLVGDLDANNYDRIRYSFAVKCGSTAIVAGNLIVGNNGAYQHLKLGKAFDITYPILYAAQAIAANSTNTQTYKAIPMTVTTTQSITLTAYKPVYIKGKLSGTIFTPVSTAPLTQTVPTSADGYHYIKVGLAYSATQMMLDAENPIYEYKDGKFGLYGASGGSESGVNQTISTTEPTTQKTGDHWLKEF